MVQPDARMQQKKQSQQQHDKSSSFAHADPKPTTQKLPLQHPKESALLQGPKDDAVTDN